MEPKSWLPFSGRLFLSVQAGHLRDIASHRPTTSQRYLAESDFRYNDRSALGINDKMRAAKAVKGVVGKRLTYHRPDEAAYAYAKGA